MIGKYGYHPINVLQNVTMWHGFCHICSNKTVSSLDEVQIENDIPVSLLIESHKRWRANRNLKPNPFGKLLDLYEVNEKFYFGRSSFSLS